MVFCERTKFRTTDVFTTNFVGSLDSRVSREVFPIGVRSPEIKPPLYICVCRPLKNPTSEEKEPDGDSTIIHNF
jgi:hypothetical protein